MILSSSECSICKKNFEESRYYIVKITEFESSNEETYEKHEIDIANKKAFRLCEECFMTFSPYQSFQPFTNKGKSEKEIITKKIFECLKIYE